MGWFLVILVIGMPLLLLGAGLLLFLLFLWTQLRELRQLADVLAGSAPVLRGIAEGLDHAETAVTEGGRLMCASGQALETLDTVFQQVEVPVVPQVQSLWSALEPVFGPIVGPLGLDLTDPSLPQFAVITGATIGSWHPFGAGTALADAGNALRDSGTLAGFPCGPNQNLGAAQPDPPPDDSIALALSDSADHLRFIATELEALAQ